MRTWCIKVLVITTRSSLVRHAEKWGIWNTSLESTTPLIRVGCDCNWKMSWIELNVFKAWLFKHPITFNKRLQVSRSIPACFLMWVIKSPNRLCHIVQEQLPHIAFQKTHPDSVTLLVGSFPADSITKKNTLCSYNYISLFSFSNMNFKLTLCLSSLGHTQSEPERLWCNRWQKADLR